MSYIYHNSRALKRVDIIHVINFLQTNVTDYVLLIFLVIFFLFPSSYIYIYIYMKKINKYIFIII
jgi:hypothetical protein